MTIKRIIFRVLAALYIIQTLRYIVGFQVFVTEHLHRERFGWVGRAIVRLTASGMLLFWPIIEVHQWRTERKLVQEPIEDYWADPFDADPDADEFPSGLMLMLYGEPESGVTEWSGLTPEQEHYLVDEPNPEPSIFGGGIVFVGGND